MRRHDGPASRTVRERPPRRTAARKLRMQVIHAGCCLRATPKPKVGCVYATLPRWPRGCGVRSPRVLPRPSSCSGLVVRVFRYPLPARSSLVRPGTWSRRGPRHPTRSRPPWGESERKRPLLSLLPHPKERVPATPGLGDVVGSQRLAEPLLAPSRKMDGVGHPPDVPVLPKVMVGVDHRRLLLGPEEDTRISRGRRADTWLGGHRPAPHPRAAAFERSPLGLAPWAVRPRLPGPHARASPDVGGTVRRSTDPFKPAWAPLTK